MRYLSVCSGIEAATQAWHPLGWQATAFSEIEPFPCAVLAHHYPSVPNWGDMTRFQEWPDATFDVLAGGTPCQSFSVAGLRGGLADPRGNLMLTYGAIAAKYRPRWLVWENVPGVLSSSGGRDFGAFLWMLGELGYGYAYRVLDAQHVRTRRFPRAVPQRRRRVWVVGYLGDWRRAAAVLFDGESLSRNPPPRREARQIPSPTLSARTRSDGGLGTDFGLGGGLIAEPLVLASGQAGAEIGIGIGIGIGTTLSCLHEAPIVAHSLRAEGFDASEDGTGRGTPIVPVCFDTKQITHPENRSNPQPGGPSHAIPANGHPPTIAFQTRGSNLDIGDISGTIGTNADRASGSAPMIAFDALAAGNSGLSIGAVPGALHGGGKSGGRAAVATTHAVRRLTPRECERLQGFPDDFTLIPWRGKPAEACPDGPRYKSLGNSWATNCAEWIGERIAMVDAL